MNLQLNTKIAFVEPRGNVNVFNQFMSIPMLGPIYLATIAENAGYQVTVINENILGRNVNSRELVDVDILCISSMTSTITRGKEIAKEYKELRKSYGLGARTLVGGIHASMIPGDVAPHFDQVFVGEAENDILDLLSGKLKGKIVYGKKLNDLNKLPFPNFKLIQNWETIKIWPILTSRGCPFDCNFCSVTEMFGRGYRVRDVENVIEELSRYKDKTIFFVDDHFVLDKKRTEKLIERMREINFKGKWSAQLRTEASKDENLVKKMKTSGCNTVYIGFESINPVSLKEFKKKQKVEDIQRSIQVFEQNNIHVHGMFIFGADTDSKDIFHLTSDFCRKSGIGSVQYMILTPLPGTEFYRKIEKENRLLHKKWEFYDAMHVVFKPAKMKPKELQQGMVSAFRKFYSYREGIQQFSNIILNILPLLIHKVKGKRKNPNFYQPILKFIGHHILNKWVKANSKYFSYLQNVSRDVYSSPVRNRTSKIIRIRRKPRIGVDESSKTDYQL
ncbi:MAG: B12-binding domain-containing radical SAM protein [Bacteroidota bacterium]